MKSSHIAHSLPNWSCVTLKKALIDLYKNNLLQGKTRAQGIVLAQKVLRGGVLNSEELSLTRALIREHTYMLASLIQKRKNI